MLIPCSTRLSISTLLTVPSLLTVSTEAAPENTSLPFATYLPSVSLPGVLSSTGVTTIFSISSFMFSGISSLSKLIELSLSCQLYSVGTFLNTSISGNDIFRLSALTSMSCISGIETFTVRTGVPSGVISSVPISPTPSGISIGKFSSSLISCDTVFRVSAKSSTSNVVPTTISIAGSSASVAGSPDMETVPPAVMDADTVMLPSMVIIPSSAGSGRNAVTVICCVVGCVRSTFSIT